MITLTKPEDWNPKYIIAGVILSYDSRFLLLQRAANDQYEPLSWGLPAGSVEENEARIQGAIRELREETGVVAQTSDLVYLFDTYQVFEKSGTALEFSFFLLELKEKPNIKLDAKDHSDYRWFTATETKDLEMVEGNTFIFDVLKERGLIT